MSWPWKPARVSRPEPPEATVLFGDQVAAIAVALEAAAQQWRDERSIEVVKLAAELTRGPGVVSGVLHDPASGCLRLVVDERKWRFACDDQDEAADVAMLARRMPLLVASALVTPDSRMLLILRGAAASVQLVGDAVTPGF